MHVYVFINKHFCWKGLLGGWEAVLDPVINSPYSLRESILKTIENWLTLLARKYRKDLPYVVIFPWKYEAVIYDLNRLFLWRRRAGNMVMLLRSSLLPPRSFYAQAFSRQNVRKPQDLLKMGGLFHDAYSAREWQRALLADMRGCQYTNEGKGAFYGWAGICGKCSNCLYGRVVNSPNSHLFWRVPYEMRFYHSFSASNPQLGVNINDYMYRAWVKTPTPQSERKVQWNFDLNLLWHFCQLWICLIQFGEIHSPSYLSLNSNRAGWKAHFTGSISLIYLSFCLFSVYLRLLRPFGHLADFPSPLLLAPPGKEKN